MEGRAWRLRRDWARGWFCSSLTLGPEPSPLGSGRLWWGSEMSFCAECLRVLLGRLYLGASRPGVVPRNWGPGAPLTEPLSVGSPRPGWSWYPCPLLLRGDWLMGWTGGLGSPTSQPVGELVQLLRDSIGSPQAQALREASSFCPIFQTTGVLSLSLLAQVQTCRQEMNPSLGPFSCSKGTGA